MTSTRLTSVLRFIRGLTSSPRTGDDTDRQLLERFRRHRDEAAFTALVGRHGPMVLGVCRRVLRNDADADDAFQATFMVLARKAGSVGRPELLGNWLYGVAYRTALKARAAVCRRRARERQVADVAIVPPPPDVVWRDLRPVLDEEVGHLPEKYRTPFVLCYLEGKTNEEAARALGCPHGTVLSRLAWARERLRLRLTRRGLALPAGVLATALSQVTASAGVPPALAGATVRAGMLAAAGTAAGAVSADVLLLAKEVMRNMGLTRRMMAAGLLALLAAGAGAIAYGMRGSGASLKSPEATKPRRAVVPVDDPPAEPAGCAWGKAVNGWQAGVAFAPGGKRTYRVGDEVSFVVVVRNVSDKKAAIGFEHLIPWPYDRYNRLSLEVRDAAGKRAPRSGPALSGVGGRGFEKRSLVAGQVSEVGVWKLTVGPPGEGKVAAKEILHAAPGTHRFHLRYKVRFQVRHWQNEDTPARPLSTGELELKIK